MSKRINHAAEARRLQGGARSIVRAINGDPALQPHMATVIMLDDARLEAQLAIVEQLRIANVFTLQSGAVNATRDAADDLVYARREDGDPVIRPEIREALGIHE